MLDMVFQGELPNSDETAPSQDHSATSKFKKVFLKKRPDSTKETPCSSASQVDSSGSQKKSSYAVTFQKIRRRVRKTYPLQEAQNSNFKTADSKQKYIATQSLDETVNHNVEDKSNAPVKRTLSQPVSVESLEIDSQSQVEEDVGSFYEATNSMPLSDFVEAISFDTRSTDDEPANNYINQVPAFSLETSNQTPSPKELESFVNIDLCELFERPDLDKLDIHQSHFAPCLSPSVKEGEKQTSNPNLLNESGQNQSLHSNLAEELIKENSIKIKASGFHYCDQYFPTLMQDSIRELACDGQFTDVIIEVDNYRMRCHRMILAASSKYFKAMFCNNYRERDQASVKIEGVSAKMMKILIRYAYTSYLEISCCDVQNVLEAASVLQFTRVMEACSNYFAGELAIENAPGIMELAQRHNLKHLLVLARLKCVTCFEELREKSDYVTLSPSLFESLISRNDLMVAQEEEVFRVLMGWCQYSEESRRQYLPQFLRHIKLPLMDKVFFARDVESHPLIRNNPALFDQLMDTRLYHVSSVTPESGQLVPRHNSEFHQVFVTVGGCNKFDNFVSDITMLDFQHKTRATLCQLPNSENSTRRPTEADTQDKKAKWAEFGCVAWRGNIVISGGKETKKEVWMFLTAVRQWVEMANLNTGRWRHRMAICDGEIYAVGGYDGFLRVDSLEKYCENENLWVEKQPMREAVSSAAVCECRGKIYVIGGGPSVKVSTDKVQIFNPSSGVWSLTTSMPEPAKCIAAVSVGGTIYVVGGTLGHVLTFDSRSKVWNTIGDALACERASCGITLCNDQIFIVGGRDDEGKAMTNVSYLDPKTKVLRSECNLAYGISHHGCVTLQKFDDMRAKAS